ncbi:MAG: DNA-3-methyladenine glycosylase family protein [Christensenellales bacterium]|jgi:N-glycosylase/DNA lyase
MRPPEKSGGFYFLTVYNEYMNNFEFIDNKAIVKNIDDFCPEQIFSCGQAFRFTGEGGVWSGIAHKRFINVKRNGADIEIWPCSREDFYDIWLNYFDLLHDYSLAKKQLCTDEFMAKGILHGWGVRILNQEPFETMISFIISSNNNMGRISRSINRICELCGDMLTGGEGYAFPTPERLASVTVEQLEECGVGYRAPYIKQSAEMAIDCDFDKFRNLPLQASCRELTRFPGIGPKVAACVQLFSLGFMQAFPIDVWVKRVMKDIYGLEKPAEIDKFALEKFKGLGGLAQQYLFYYAREAGIGK